MERPDWIRSTIDSAVAGAANGTPADTLEAQPELAAAQARIDGLEALVEQERERQGMSDSLNQELNQRLREAHAISDRFQLAVVSRKVVKRGLYRDRPSRHPYHR